MSLSAASIAKQLGVPKAKVDYAVRALGLGGRPTGRKTGLGYTPAQVERIKALLAKSAAAVVTG